MLKELIYPITFATLTIYGNSIVVGRQLEDMSRKIGSTLDSLELRMEKKVDGMAKKMDLLAFRQHELETLYMAIAQKGLIDCSKRRDDPRIIHRE